MSDLFGTLINQEFLSTGLFVERCIVIQIIRKYAGVKCRIKMSKLLIFSSKSYAFGFLKANVTIMHNITQVTIFVYIYIHLFMKILFVICRKNVMI